MGKLVKCCNCKKKIPQEAKFCRFCGFAQNTTKKCPECGVTLADGLNFCPECGFPIKKKKSGIKIIVAVIVAITLIAGLFFFLYENEYFFSGKKIKEVKSIYKEEQKAEVTSTKEDDSIKEEKKNESVKDEVDSERTTSEVDYEDGVIHRYSIIVDDVSWTEASRKCKQIGGYLVNIGSEEEYIYIVQQIESEGKRGNSFWIGGERGFGDASEYNYYWVRNDGTYSDYAVNSKPDLQQFWMVGEPSFVDGETVENKMNMFYRKSEDRYVWNDAPDNILDVVPSYSGNVGYICEFDD